MHLPCLALSLRYEIPYLFPIPPGTSCLFINIKSKVEKQKKKKKETSKVGEAPNILPSFYKEDDDMMI